LIKRFSTILFLFIIIFSCSTKKDIAYLQKINNNYDFTNYYSQYKLSTDDILKIDVDTEFSESEILYATSDVSQSSNSEILLYNGYQINNDGEINFPGIGKIKLAGKTLIEARDVIYNKLVKQKEILLNPTIDIKILNSHFTILGEVNAPGKYNFLENNLNIFEAVGLAGDLTINGVRKDVKIIRNYQNNFEVLTVDLTTPDAINSAAFQIFSGDIIIVNQNSSKIKNAGIIGNSGTLLSLLSFLLSSIIVIVNS